MELLEGLTSRRSVRKFTDEPIPRETIERIVETARFAPSWKNTQVVRYHVFPHGEITQRIAEDCVLQFDFNAKTISRAPVVVLLTVQTGISGFEPDGTPSTPKGAAWEAFDAGIAAQSFCLAAWEEGLGSTILGVFDENEVRKVVSLPENESVAAILVMGHPFNPPRPAPPRKAVSELLIFHS